VSPCAGDMGPSWGPFTFRGGAPTQKLSVLKGTFLPYFLTLDSLGAMAEGGEGEGHVLRMSPESADCGEYEDTKSCHRCSSEWPPRSHNMVFWAHSLALSAMAHEGKGGGRGNCWCSHVQGTWGHHEGPSFSAGTLPVHRYCQLSVIASKILPVFFTLQPHGAGGAGRGRVMLVFPCARDIGPA
jgi:hypothetical protein